MATARFVYMSEDPHSLYNAFLKPVTHVYYTPSIKGKRVHHHPLVMDIVTLSLATC
jgi:hypothetical protein